MKHVNKLVSLWKTENRIRSRWRWCADNEEKIVENVKQEHLSLGRRRTIFLPLRFSFIANVSCSLHRFLSLTSLLMILLSLMVTLSFKILQRNAASNNTFHNYVSFNIFGWETFSYHHHPLRLHLQPHHRIMWRALL